MKSEVLALRLVGPLWIQRKLSILESYGKGQFFQLCGKTQPTVLAS